MALIDEPQVAREMTLRERSDSAREELFTLIEHFKALEHRVSKLEREVLPPNVPEMRGER